RGGISQACSQPVISASQATQLPLKLPTRLDADRVRLLVNGSGQRTSTRLGHIQGNIPVVQIVVRQTEFELLSNALTDADPESNLIPLRQGRGTELAINWRLVEGNSSAQIRILADPVEASHRYPPSISP